MSDFMEKIYWVYVSSSVLIIVSSLMAMYYCWQQKNSNKYSFIIAEFSVIIWHCCLFWKYEGENIIRLIQLIGVAVLYAFFYCTTSILDIYKVLVPKVITEKRILVGRIIVGLACAFTMASYFLPDKIAAISTIAVSAFLLIYHQLQGIFLAKIVYCSKGELKKPLANSFRLMTAVTCALSALDWIILAAYYYTVFILPKSDSIFPFIMNMIGLHAIVNVFIFYRLLHLTLMGSKAYQQSLIRRSTKNKDAVPSRQPSTKAPQRPSQVVQSTNAQQFIPPPDALHLQIDANFKSTQLLERDPSP